MPTSDMIVIGVSLVVVVAIILLNAWRINRETARYEAARGTALSDYMK